MVVTGKVTKCMLEPMEGAATKDVRIDLLALSIDFFLVGTMAIWILDHCCFPLLRWVLGLKLPSSAPSTISIQPRLQSSFLMHC
jgi:hypothetical protein